MPKNLTNDDIIQVLREEWDKKVSLFEKRIDIDLVAKPTNDENKLIVTPELKVRHKNSGIRYTVDSVSTRDVILRTPEGERFLVHGSEFESDYELS